MATQHIWRYSRGIAYTDVVTTGLDFMFTIFLDSVCKILYQDIKRRAYANLTLTSRCDFKLDDIVMSGFLLRLLMHYQNVLSDLVKVRCMSAALVTRYERRLLLGRKNTEVKAPDISR